MLVCSFGYRLPAGAGYAADGDEGGSAERSSTSPASSTSSAFVCPYLSAMTPRCRRPASCIFGGLPLAVFSLDAVVHGVDLVDGEIALVDKTATVGRADEAA